MDVFANSLCCNELTGLNHDEYSVLLHGVYINTPGNMFYIGMGALRGTPRRGGSGGIALQNSR
jgi:hypothetical protein